MILIEEISSLLVMEMRVKIPWFPTLRVQNSPRALHKLIARLKEQQGTKLNDKQTTVLIKIVEASLSSIQQSRGRAK